MTPRRYSYFRRYEPLAASSWRLIPLALLALFDIWAVVYMLVNVWRIWGAR